MKLGAWHRQGRRKDMGCVCKGGGKKAIVEKDIRGFPWVTYPHVRYGFGG